MTEKKPGEPGERDKALAKNLCICLGLAEREQDLEPFDVGTAAVAFAATRRAGAREALERAADLVATHDVIWRDGKLLHEKVHVQTISPAMQIRARAIRALADQPEAEGRQAPGVADLALMRGEAPAKVLPPCDSNASKAEILYNHEKRIAFLEKIACGGPVLYNEKRVLSLAEPPHPPAKADAPGTCALCGKPMPPGEEMFKYHGYSGPCPEPEAAHGRKK